MKEERRSTERGRTHQPVETGRTDSNVLDSADKEERFGGDGDGEIAPGVGRHVASKREPRGLQLRDIEEEIIQRRARA